MTMFKAILFDLDGTLLAIDNAQFVHTYFRSMASRIGPLFGGRDYTQPIMAGTDAMIHSQGHHASLRELFIEVFDQTSPVPFAVAEPTFTEFYHHEFNQMSAISKPYQQAMPILRAASRVTHNIVLATVPLFPLIAIQARCRWAGIDAFPFTLITSFENMRHSKPNPAYYLEIADRIKVSASDCLMVGNDHIDDLSAAAAGMETYLVLDDPLNAGKSPYTPTYSGTLDDRAISRSA